MLRMKVELTAWWKEMRKRRRIKEGELELGDKKVTIVSERSFKLYPGQEVFIGILKTMEGITFLHLFLSLNHRHEARLRR